MLLGACGSALGVAAWLWEPALSESAMAPTVSAREPEREGLRGTETVEPAGGRVLVEAVTAPAEATAGLAPDTILTIDGQVEVVMGLKPPAELHGRVRFETVGEDGSRVPVSNVGVVQLVDGEPAPGVATGGVGSFMGEAEVVGPAGRALVIAAGPTLRPAMARAEFIAGVTLSAGQLRLERGATIRGTLRTPPGAALPEGSQVGPHEVVIELEADGPRVEVRGHALVWTNGRFEWASVRAALDESGEFEMSGFAPRGRYRVRWGERVAETVAGGPPVHL